MITLLKILSILLIFSPILLIYTETTSILIAVLPFVAGALLYTYTLSKKPTQKN